MTQVREIEGFRQAFTCDQPYTCKELERLAIAQDFRNLLIGKAYGEWRWVFRPRKGKYRWLYERVFMVYEDVPASEKETLRQFADKGIPYLRIPVPDEVVI